MSNIIKGFYSLILLLILSASAFGQQMIESGDELDVNGEVYSIKRFDAFGKYYAMCGDFTSINGNGPYTNFAIINPSTLQATAFSFMNVNGPVYDFALYYESFPANMYHLYIAGDFTVVNGQARNGMAKFSAVNNFGDTPDDFLLQTWNPELPAVLSSNDKMVLDLELRNDTLYAAGNFQYVNNGALLTDFRNGIAAFDAASGNDLSMFIPSTPCNSGISSGIASVNKIALGEYHILVAGDLDNGSNGGSFYRYNYDGCLDNTYPPQEGWFSGTQWNGTGADIAIANDTVYGGIFDTNVWFDTDTVNSGQPPIIVNPPSTFVAKDYQPPNPSGYTLTPSSITAYKDKFFVTQEVTGTPLAIPRVYYIDSSGTGNFQFGQHILTDFTDLIHEHIFVVDNVMICTYNGNFTQGSSNRTGAAAYCLEPADAGNFTVFDTTICQGDTLIYSIPATAFADGYEWSFSNNGVTLGPNIPNPPGTNFEETTLPTIEIEFLDNFQPGILTVTPYSTCNDMTIGLNRVYSKPMILPIGFDALPNALAGPDTLINCFNDSVSLVGFSDTAGVTYAWKQELNPPLNFVPGQIHVAHDSDYYVLRVEGLNGCRNFDTVFVDMDTIRPNFDPIVPGLMGCEDTMYVLGHCNNTADTLSWWVKTGFPAQYNNPLPAWEQGFYQFYTQDTINGCQDYTEIFITQDQTPPAVEIAGYTIPSLGTPIETLDCYTPSITLTVTTPTANTGIYWVDVDTLQIGVSQLFTGQGNYLIEAIDSNTSCYNYAQISIAQDFTVPTIHIDSVLNKLNCSNDSLMLNGSTNSFDTLLSWTGPGPINGVNPVFIQTPGYYTFEVFWNPNGCSSLDSVLVIQDNSIDVLISNDTAVCEGSAAPVSASYVGNISGITYLWNNGTTSATSNYIGGQDSIAVVEINGDLGCYGTDTVYISVPPVPVVEFLGFKPCGASNTGYLVANPLSGWGPYEYSIDGGLNFQTSNTISGLSTGSYTVTVRDSLDCSYDYNATIDEGSSLPTPEFLLSSFNFESDTLAIVNVSSPMPDSVSWTFPPSFSLIDINDTIPLVIMPDTGVFVISMDAFYGTCVSTISRTVHVTEFDTTFANYFNENSIKSAVLYPAPNDGTFTVDVELFKKQNVSIVITDMLGVFRYQKDYVDVLNLSDSFVLDAAALSGNYICRVVAEFDATYIKFTINK